MKCKNSLCKNDATVNHVVETKGLKITNQICEMCSGAIMGDLSSYFEEITVRTQ